MEISFHRLIHHYSIKGETLMSAQNYTEILEYITASKFGLLTYVRSDRTPISRAMGSFAPDGINLYFSTARDSGKVSEIQKNGRVSFYFEHDGQAPERWKSVLLIGDVELLESGDSYSAAVNGLADKSPRFRERVEKGDLSSAAVYKVNTREIQFLDRSKGYGPPVTVIVP
jgi:nitroimidazol reductase NimA-like FMN-containing flavoprotein (pyridoxamine 5'-phosphate oxidase superfamily)